LDHRASTTVIGKHVLKVSLRLALRTRTASLELTPSNRTRNGLGKDVLPG
jgi:hypothetical protein